MFVALEADPDEGLHDLDLTQARVQPMNINLGRRHKSDVKMNEDLPATIIYVPALEVGLTLGG